MAVNIILDSKLNFNIISKKNSKYKYLVIFNETTHIKYLIDLSAHVLVFKNLNYLSINSNFFSNSDKTQQFLNNLNKSINFYFTKKINFSGKGYKIRKLQKTLEKYMQKSLMFYFNKSHLNVLYFFGFKIKKLKKTKLFILTTSSKNLNLIVNLILSIKHFNPFTSKGLRLSRQVVYKKIGKKSS